MKVYYFYRFVYAVWRKHCTGSIILCFKILTEHISRIRNCYTFPWCHLCVCMCVRAHMHTHTHTHPHKTIYSITAVWPVWLIFFTCVWNNVSNPFRCEPYYTVMSYMLYKVVFSKWCLSCSNLFCREAHKSWLLVYNKCYKWKTQKIRFIVMVVTAF